MIGERRVTGGNGWNPAGQKLLICSDMAGFWLCDKYRIIGAADLAIE